MATIINLILKGSALLNRLRDRQAANRKAQLEQERQRKDAAKARQARQAAIPQRSQVATFARREEEPAATPTGAPVVLLISCTFVDLPDWSFPDGVTTGSEASAALNARAEPATGTLTTVTAPPFTREEWQDFDGRAPQAGGIYQRLYRPYTAIHDRGLSFAFGHSYAVLPRSLSLSGTDVTTMSPPQFVDLRTDPTAQEFPFMVYAHVMGPRGFAMGFDGSDIIAQVYTQTSAPDSNDRAGCAILLAVGEQVRIVPFVIYESVPTRDAANSFMQYYLYPYPDRLYTITAVDRSVAGQVRYTITGGNWPAIAVSGLRFYMIRSYATWAQVPAAEVRWASDLQGIPVDDLPPNPLNDETDNLSAGFSYQKPYKKDAYIATIYEHSLFSTDNPRLRYGPTGLAAAYPNDDNLAAGFDDAYSAYRAKFSAASRRIIASESGAAPFDQIMDDDDAWEASIPDDYVPTYKLRRFEPVTTYDEDADVVTFNFSKDGDDNADSPYYPVRIPRTQLSPLLDSTRGNWLFGYNPPFRTYDSRVPPGRYANLSVSIISP